MNEEAERALRFIDKYIDSGKAPEEIPVNQKIFRAVWNNAGQENRRSDGKVAYRGHLLKPDA